MALILLIITTIASLKLFVGTTKKENLYEFMGLSPNSNYDQKELKRNYLKLSKMYHPDKNPSEDAAN